MSVSVTYSRTTTKTFVQNFLEITKFRLSVSVVFSSVVGYLLGAPIIDFSILFLLAVGGYCMVGASNIFNQIIERDLDALMNRTKNRPIPSGRMTVNSFTLAYIDSGLLYGPSTRSRRCLCHFNFCISLYITMKIKHLVCVCFAFPGAICLRLMGPQWKFNTAARFYIQLKVLSFFKNRLVLYDDYVVLDLYASQRKRDKRTATQAIMYVYDVGGFTMLVFN